MRLIFAGTPDFAAKHLQTLIDSEHEIVAVYTQPDRPAGRGKKLQASAVKQCAEAAGLPVYQPFNFKSAEAQEQLSSFNCDVMVVVAYGLILPIEVLEAPKLACINVHASLLPRWRGAAPIQRAIEAGDASSGITIMRMDVGLDTGDMILIESIDLDSRESSASLYQKFEAMGPPLLLKALQQIEDGSAQFTAQDDSKSTYAAKILKAEATIDWGLSVAEIDRKIRAFTPFPICTTSLADKSFKIHSATPNEPKQKPSKMQAGQFLVEERNLFVRCKDGFLQLETVQLAGKKASSARDFINGSKALLEIGHFGQASSDNSNAG